MKASLQVSKALNTFLLLLCLLITLQSKAQGDNCDNALPLLNLSNFCSNQGQYTNVGSTPSAFPAATCWTGNPLEDVWFTFVAIGTDVLISVNGNTITRPRIALFTGSCSGTLNQLGNGCTNGTAGSPDAQIYLGGLVQGTTYYIRISTIAADEGTFQLCINNYIPPVSASADCSGAGKLCNKNPVSVANLSGGGSNVDELNGVSCFTSFGFATPESNTVWYTWTCATAGTLTMDIVPANQTEDLDFVIFRLNTANPCGPRVPIRCSATAFINAQASTGMNATSVDTEEGLGFPPGADAYVQQITMTAGTSYAILILNASTANGFTISWGGTGTFVGPEANITSNALSVCLGTAVTLDGNTSTNYTGLDWNFANGPGNPSSATGPGPHTITYDNPGTYTAILNATDAGCISTESVIVTVNAPETATFNQIGPLCEGVVPPTLPATSTNGITGTWSPNVISTTTLGTTTYTFTPDNGQCSFTTATMDITINPNVVLTFADVPAFCQGTAAPSFPTQTSAPVIPGMWSPGTIANSASGSYTFTPSAGQCSSPASINITVKPLPVVDISSNAPICIGETLTLSANTIDGGIYDWSGPNAFVATTEDPILPNATLADAGTYTLQITDTSGCVGEASIDVVINSPVAPVLEPAGPFCNLNTTNIGLSADIPGGTWTGNGVTDPNGIFVPNTAGVGTHTLTYVHTQGCGGSATMDIVVNAEPDANFTADTLAGCAPLTVHFTSNPNVDAAVWNFGDQNQATTVGSADHTYEHSGQYTVTLTNTLSGCSTTNSVTNFITIYPDPVADFDASSTILTQVETEVSFYNNSENAVAYHWDFGDESSSTAVDPTHIYPKAPGSYTVMLIAVSPDGCIDLATLAIVVKEEQIIYVPNSFTPNGDGFNNEFKPILAEGFDLDNYTLLIYNRWGEVVFKTTDTNEGWDGTYHGSLVQDGTFTWTIRVKNRTDDEYNTYNGHLILVR